MTRPLDGKRIVITRAMLQADSFARLLENAGALPLIYPCIAVVPPADTAPLDTALRAAAAGVYDWLILTSVNAVDAVAARLKELGLSPASLRWQIAVVGPATAEAARARLGADSAAAPEPFTARSLAGHLDLKSGARALLPGSSLTEPAVISAFEASGAQVTPVVAYQTVIGTGGVDLPVLLAEHAVDTITFASPSALRNCLLRLAAEGGEPASLARIPIVCIGPATAQAALDAGISAAIMPSEQTITGLINALETYFKQEHPHHAAS